MSSFKQKQMPRQPNDKGIVGTQERGKDRPCEAVTRVREHILSPLALVLCLGRHVELPPLTVSQMGSGSWLVGPVKDWKYCEAQSGDPTELEMPALGPRVGESLLDC